jgi:hypothetical protein
MGTNTVELQIFDTAEEAPNYNTNGEGFKGANLLRAVIVRKGTKEGRPTVDLQFQDNLTGQKYVALATGAILKLLVDMFTVVEGQGETVTEATVQDKVN